MATDPKSPRRFEELLAETRWLGRLAAQLVPPADREDLVQDVLVSAMRTERPKHLRGWLGTVARNLAARRKTKELNRRSREQTVARNESSEPSAADALEAFASHRTVVNAVMDLDEPYRTAVLLRFWEDLPPREVARRTGVPVETARTRIKRGVDRLRAMLDDRSGGRSAWMLPLLQIGGVREAFLAGSATAAGTGGTMAPLPILTGALAMKKAALATVAVASVVATVVMIIQGDPPADQWSGRDRTGLHQVGTEAPAKTARSQEVLLPTDRTVLSDEQSTAATGAGLVVKVLDKFGSPAEGVRVWRWIDSETGEDSTRRVEDDLTDAQGLVHLASSKAAGGLVVVARDHVTVVRRLARLAGRHRVQLQAGARVHGWIRVDGQVSTEPIRLMLWGRPYNDPLGDLPSSLQEDVRSYRRERYRTIKTTAQCAFEFTGLAKDWHGRIRLPMNLWFRGPSLQEVGDFDPRVYRLARPRTGLQLETTMLPGVRGRVVWSDTGEPIPRASVHAVAVLPSGKDSPMYGLSTDYDGCFCVGFCPGSDFEQRAWIAGKRGPVRSVRLSVSKPGASEVKREIEDPQKLTPPGFVEIRMDRALQLHFVAVGLDGEPVAGAILKGTRRSKPADTRGRGVVDVKDPGRRRFLAAAPGHVVDELKARSGIGTSESPLEFVFAKGNQVVVAVQRSDGRPLQDLELSVRCKQPLFTGSKEGRPTLMHCMIGGKFWGGSWGKGTMDYQYQIDETGEVVLPSLRPDVPFQLAVLDRLKQEAVVRDVVTPPASATRRVVLRLKEPLQGFTGVVVDDHDVPVAHARVATTVGRWSPSCSTDRKGCFRFESVYPTGKTYPVRVTRRGYQRVDLEDVGITKEMEPLKIRMLRGHDVKLTFVDPEGERLPVTSCEVEGNMSFGWERLEPGLLLVKDLPAGPQVFKAHVGGRTYQLRHDPVSSKTARFVLPAMGRIQVETPRPSGLKWHDVRAVITARSDRKSFQVSFARCGNEPKIRTGEQLLLPGKYVVEVRTDEEDGNQLLHPARQVTIDSGKLSLCRIGAN